MERRRFLIRTGQAIFASAVVSPLSFYTAGAASKTSDTGATLTLFLSGDVMTGRGIDQVLPHSVDPRLYEKYPPVLLKKWPPIFSGIVKRATG